MRPGYAMLITLFLLGVFLLGGCGATESGATSPSALSPGQVNDSMVDQLVEVKGRVLWVTENPGGLGGIYARLGDGNGYVGVRIQSDVWGTLDDSTKAQFREGGTATAKGVVFKAGKELVIVYGRLSPEPRPNPAPG